MAFQVIKIQDQPEVYETLSQKKKKPTSNSINKFGDAWKAMYCIYEELLRNDCAFENKGSEAWWHMYVILALRG